MSLPYFFTPDLSQMQLVLDEETSRHVVQVLRMKSGDRLLLTDGNGNTAEAEIEEAHKKRCLVRVISRDFQPRPSHQLTIAVSLIKNSSRFEWFVEKATELGVARIIPMICERTEREKFRSDRYINISRSAMLQSKQSWLPVLEEPQDFTDLVRTSNHHQRFIAHCADDEKQMLHSAYDLWLESHIILIGPEGDFTQGEIDIAKEHGFVPVSLGRTRLRTETAAIYAAVTGTITG
jgi:16S rRNA (uracil1498-N3)-methyltransferase